jgi:hypothetical protein
MNATNYVRVMKFAFRELQDLLNFDFSHLATLKTFASTRQQQITSSLSFQEWTTFSEVLGANW